MVEVLLLVRNRSRWTLPQAYSSRRHCRVARRCTFPFKDGTLLEKHVKLHSLHTYYRLFLPSHLLFRTLLLYSWLKSVCCSLSVFLAFAGDLSCVDYTRFEQLWKETAVEGFRSA